MNRIIKNSLVLVLLIFIIGMSFSTLVYADDNTKFDGYLDLNDTEPSYQAEILEDNNGENYIRINKYLRNDIQQLVMPGPVMPFATTRPDIVYPLLEIGENAFEGHSELKSVKTSYVTHIRNNAFTSCSNLETIEFPDTYEYKLEYIGDEVFYGCKKLKNVTFPSSTVWIGDRAFYDCEGLQTITLGKSIANIGEDAFGNCVSLKEINVDSQNPHITNNNNDGVLYTKDMKTLIAYPPAKEGESFSIPEGITTVNMVAFSDCSNLKSLTIPKSVETLQILFIANCKKLEQINVDPANPNFASVDGVLYTKDLKQLICFPAGKDATNYTFPSETTEIGEYAFECNSSTSIAIPETVTTISNTAFSNATTTIIAKPNSAASKIQSGEGVQVSVDGTAPVLSVKYNKINANKVEAIIEANEAIQLINGWTYVDNTKNKSIKCEFTQNIEKNYSVKDLIGNVATIKVKIDSIGSSGGSGEEQGQGPVATVTITKDGSDPDANQEYKAGDKIKIQAEFDKAILENYPPKISMTGVATLQEENMQRKTEKIYYTEYTIPSTATTGGVQKITIKGAKDTSNNEMQSNVTTFNIKSSTGNETQNLTVTVENYEETNQNGNNYISKVVPKTTAQSLLDSIRTNGTSKLYKGTSEVSDSNTKISTGMSVKVSLNTENKEYVIVVKGDTNCDGESDIKDMLLINKHRLNKSSLSGEKLLAGDVNGDNVANIRDMLIINKYRLGKITEI